MGIATPGESFADGSAVGELRVLLVAPRSAGGIGRHVASLAAGLRRRGVAVVDRGPVGPRALPRLLAAARQVEIVHAHGLRAALAAAAVLGRSRPRRPPLVVTWHNVAPTTGWRRGIGALLERTVARRAEVTLAASTDLAERARMAGARDVRCCPVAAPALTAPRRDRETVRAELGAVDRPLVLAVGRLAAQKDYPLLLDAAVLLAGRDPAPLVVIAGDGPLRGALTRRITSGQLPVRLLGARDDVADLLAAADVVVLTSRWEARPLVAQEAMAAGVPLVATAVGGVPDLVGDAALLVGPRQGVDVAGRFAAAVSRVLDSPQLAAKLAERGRRRAAGWPGESDTVDAVLACYADALARRTDLRRRR